jgi:hypothetical protein
MEMEKSPLEELKAIIAEKSEEFCIKETETTKSPLEELKEIIAVKNEKIRDDEKEKQIETKNLLKVTMETAPYFECEKKDFYRV